MQKQSVSCAEIYAKFCFYEVTVFTFDFEVGREKLQIQLNGAHTILYHIFTVKWRQNVAHENNNNVIYYIVPIVNSCNNNFYYNFPYCSMGFSLIIYISMKLLSHSW